MALMYKLLIGIVICIILDIVCWLIWAIATSGDDGTKKEVFFDHNIADVLGKIQVGLKIMPNSLAENHMILMQWIDKDEQAEEEADLGGDSSIFDLPTSLPSFQKEDIGDHFFYF